MPINYLYVTPLQRSGRAARRTSNTPVLIRQKRSPNKRGSIKRTLKGALNTATRETSIRRFELLMMSRHRHDNVRTRTQRPVHTYRTYTARRGGKAGHPARAAVPGGA
ncbi:hypothetical protein EVAR_47210_1 [Eumeta japonica]|uniref:Uncharacterized protein n=1 Tax=Eumeta variegata TaxID=151549 RepID=A0A4C1XUP0_EUMVA|nr:hypothetical protein EVAR_47210_1 [Eumeta japonica]